MGPPKPRAAARTPVTRCFNAGCGNATPGTLICSSCAMSDRPFSFASQPEPASADRRRKPLRRYVE